MSIRLFETHVPVIPNRDELGACYNEIMENATTDFVLLMDGDVLPMCEDWYTQIHLAITDLPKAGIITAMTNHIGCSFQLSIGSPLGNDMKGHWAFGNMKAKVEGGDYTQWQGGPLISGFFMLVNKMAWNVVKDANGCGFLPGFLGVDNYFHRDVMSRGFKVYRMNGLYCYHAKLTTGCKL